MAWRIGGADNAVFGFQVAQGAPCLGAIRGRDAAQIHQGQQLRAVESLHQRRPHQPLPALPRGQGIQKERDERNVLVQHLRRGAVRAPGALPANVHAGAARLGAG